jgi:hypothetical protein
VMLATLGLGGVGGQGHTPGHSRAGTP